MAVARFCLLHERQGLRGARKTLSLRSGAGCAELVTRRCASAVDEIACLIDFGVDFTIG